MQDFSRVRAAGIDGCRGGWFAFLLEGICGSLPRADAAAPVRVAETLLFDTEDFSALAGLLDRSSLVLIDIPIGLPLRGARGSDFELRKLLGRRRGSVFPMPVRDAVYAASYEEACRINTEAIGKKLSKQTWNILGKVKSIDRFLRMREEYRLTLRESSPEYCFTLAAPGRALDHGKRTREGIGERSDILAGYITDWNREQAAVRTAYPRTGVADDDILDAAVLAVSGYFAVCGGAVLVPSVPGYDEYGLPVQAVFGRPPSRG